MSAVPVESSRLSPALARTTNASPITLDDLRRWRGSISGALVAVLGCSVDPAEVKADRECCLAIRIAANVLVMASSNCEKFGCGRDGVIYSTGYDLAPLRAVETILDRLEGKAVQSINVTTHEVRDPASVRAELLSILAASPQLMALAATRGWSPPTPSSHATPIPSVVPAGFGEAHTAVAVHSLEGVDVIDAATSPPVSPPETGAGASLGTHERRQTEASVLPVKEASASGVVHRGASATNVSPRRVWRAESLARGFRRVETESVPEGALDW